MWDLMRRERRFGGLSLSTEPSPSCQKVCDRGAKEGAVELPGVDLCTYLRRAESDFAFVGGGCTRTFHCSARTHFLSINVPQLGRWNMWVD